MLLEAHLDGLLETIMEGIHGLKDQAAPSGGALNTKFQRTGKFTMGYGGLDVFFGGLEALLGPPQAVKDPEHPEGIPTIRRAMEQEHTAMKDSALTFTSSNGCTTQARTEWEVAYQPKADARYPERKGLEREHHRSFVPILSFMESGGQLETEANARLREEGHSEIILEELLGGRLYTGPMCTCQIP